MKGIHGLRPVDVRERVEVDPELVRELLVVGDGLMCRCNQLVDSGCSRVAVLGYADKETNITASLPELITHLSELRCPICRLLAVSLV